MVYGPGGPASALARAKTMQGVKPVAEKTEKRELRLLDDDQVELLKELVRELLRRHASEDRRE